MNTSIKNTSQWIKAISESHDIRCVLIDATHLVNELIHTHQLVSLQAQALGEATVAALMLASYLKSGEQLNLQIQGSGVCQKAFVDASPEGVVRGYLIPNTASSHRHTLELTEELGIWGHGILSVLRTKGEDRSRPYMGAVPLATGVLEKDLKTYWTTSEQVATSLALSVEMSQKDCNHAIGILLQSIGGANDDDISLVLNSQKKIDSIIKKVIFAQDPLKELNDSFEQQFSQSSPFKAKRSRSEASESPVGTRAQDAREGRRKQYKSQNHLNFKAIEERTLFFACNCSIDRVKRALHLIGHDELNDMISKNEHASVRCDFCTKEYHLSVNELKALL